MAKNYRQIHHEMSQNRDHAHRAYDKGYKQGYADGFRKATAEANEKIKELEGIINATRDSFV